MSDNPAPAEVGESPQPPVDGESPVKTQMLFRGFPESYMYRMIRIPAEVATDPDPLTNALNTMGIEGWQVTQLLPQDDGSVMCLQCRRGVVEPGPNSSRLLLPGDDEVRRMNRAQRRRLNRSNNHSD